MEGIEPLDNNDRQYDPRTIALHWIIAGLIIFQWLGAHAIDWFPKGPWRIDARSIHIIVGLTLAILLIARIQWRLTRGHRLPPAHAGALQFLAKSMHLGLYATIASIVTLGIFTTWIRGDSLFNIANIPHFGSYTPDARHQFAEYVVGWHVFMANLILILAAGHILSAIMQSWMNHNRPVLERMGLRLGRKS